MKTSVVLATLVLCSSFYSIAHTPDDTSAEILNRLDMTSFPNSLGPRHLKQGTTLSELKITTVSSEKGMATATNADKSWTYALNLLNEDKQKETYTVCFNDKAVPGPPTYNNSQELVVKKSSQGTYKVIQVITENSECASAK
ncbi:hypothetical protein R3D73_005198 [Serratia marcescens]|nr:hypothetical protein [Serratia marcescens]ELQ9442289.1 hypothetical protein [Serratia marcescens]ELT5563049.1 hypothetical protein [Serratia marcescens]